MTPVFSRKIHRGFQVERWIWFLTPIVLVLATLLQTAEAQTPSNPYSYSRTASFEYFSAADGIKSGLLKAETIEPDNIASCLRVEYDYDSYGNENITTTRNCSGTVPLRQQFLSRSESKAFSPATMPTVVVGGVGVVLPKGAFPVVLSNALNQSEQREYDPRFGAVTKITDANQLASTLAFDDFGREVKKVYTDGTSSVTYYCYLSGRVDDISSNSPGCPSVPAEEIFSEAVHFTHTEDRDTTGLNKISPFTRVYSDKLGRTIRTVTEGFDGAAQTSSLKGATVVQDVGYNIYGAKVLESQPYFLATRSSTTTGTNDLGIKMSFYDALGRLITTYVADPNGSGGTGFATLHPMVPSYFGYGFRTVAATRHSYSANSVTTTNDKGQIRTEEYDFAGKVFRVTDSTGAQVAYQRDAFGNLVATKDALQNTITLKYDIRGRKVELSDPDAGLLKYDYDPLGQLVWQESPNQRAAGSGTTMAYDKLGRMTSRTEPDLISTWNYDTYASGSACTIGKLCESSASNGVRKQFSYNRGRPSATRVTMDNGLSFARGVTYNATTGRLATETYPSGLTVSYGYTTGTAKGYLETLSLLTALTVNPLPSSVGGTPAASTTITQGNGMLWRAQVVNAWGKVEQQIYSNGNGSVNRAQFEAFTGRTTGLTVGPGTGTNVLNHSYTWDSLNNLQARVDNIGDGSTGAVTETFEYGDGINRLTRYSVASAAIPGLNRAVTLQYNALGALLSKSDVGVYAYGASGAGTVRPHALQTLTAAGNTTSYGYDANGNLTSASGGKYRSIRYNSFNLPDSETGIIGAAGGSSNGTARYTWGYDENHARLKEVRTISGGSMAGTRTTWSLHPDNVGGLAYEMEVNSPASASAANPAVTSHRHYLTVGGKTIGVLVSTGNLPGGPPGVISPTVVGSISLVKMEYWHKDHLGSLAATTDHAGTVTARYAYDPFGKRRHTNGNYDGADSIIGDWSPATNKGTDRGFTGHEHLDDLALVHMNGRIFSPGLGLFLQADPKVTDPGNLQSFNRYGYCLNNPLTCTDPSGFDSDEDGWDGCSSGCYDSNGNVRLDAVYITGARIAPAPQFSFSSGGAAANGFSAGARGMPGPFFAYGAAPGQPAQQAFEKAFKQWFAKAADDLAAKWSFYQAFVNFRMNAMANAAGIDTGKDAGSALDAGGADNDPNSYAKPPANARDPNGPKAPGKPPAEVGFRDPKGGENWAPNPNPGKGGGSHGWQDADGNVWVPSGQGGRAHGGPHWDVQTPGGGYSNVRPPKP